MPKARDTTAPPAASLFSKGTEVFERLFYGSPLYRRLLKGKIPEKLRGSPPDPFPGDRKKGAYILRGAIPFDGGEIIIDDNLWTGAAPPDAVRNFLHGFGWLSDLRTHDTNEAKRRARSLVSGWMNHNGRWRRQTWRADVLGQRLTNWLTGAAYLNDGADGTFARRFLISTSEQARHLERICPGRSAIGRENPAAAFSAIKGLIYCGLCLPGFEVSLERGLALLDREIARRVMADGSHSGGAPSMALAVLRHLTDIRGALTIAQVGTPPAIRNAIGRITPMIRALRLGDGGLVAFGGGKEIEPGYIDAVLGQAAVRGKPPAALLGGGLHRLAAGRTIVIIDTGRPVASRRKEGESRFVSFEMSAGKDRMVVHRGDDGGGNRAVGKSKTERRETDGNIWLDCDYGAGRGFHHQRRLFLDAAGEDLRGEDSLHGGNAKDRTFTICFHLHPGVHASLVEDASAVLLKLPHGPGWRFLARGGEIKLSESRFETAAGDVKRSEQITVSGPLTGNDEVKWAFKMEKKQARTVSRS